MSLFAAPISQASAVPTSRPALFALLYFVAALVWLVITDWLQLRFFPDSPEVQTLKGAVFMGMSALIVWALVHQSTRSWRAQNDSLQRQVAFNRGVLEASPIPVIVVDTERKIVHWSPVAASIFGWSSEEVSDSNIPCFADEHAVWNDNLWEDITNGTRISSIPCHAERRDGSGLPITLSAAPLLSDEHGFIGAIVLLHDVSAHHDAMERLRASERRLRHLFEDNPRPMWLYELDSNRIVLVNAAAIEQYGYTDEEFRSLTIFDLRPQEERERLRSNLSRPRARVERSAGWTHRRKDGSLLEVEIDSHLIDMDGRQHVVVVGHDVTEQNRLARENEQASQQLRRMTSKLLHAQEDERRHLARELHDESGAMLTALQLCLKMAERNAEADPERARAHISDAKDVAADLAGRMRQISMNLLPGVLDDLGLEAAVRWFTTRFARQTAIQITLDIKLERRQRIDSHLETIAYRIIQEALTNVARHSGALAATVRLSVEKEELRIEVADDGHGFDYDQVLNSDRLGLHSMKERCVLANGAFDILSDKDGTRVFAILPLKRELQDAENHYRG
jgi:PAS domain S-box-containing protein